MKITPGILIALLLLPGAARAVDPGKAWIVTDVHQPVSCISSVAIYQIDGNNVLVSHQQFDIDPGNHTMTGRAQLDMRYCRAKSSTLPGPDRIKYEPLSGFFEAGMKYYVGFDHSAEERENWGLVVWKIESFVDGD